MSRNTLVPLLE
jgi:tetratricopeptide (TPR) repeat protein